EFRLIAKRGNADAFGAAATREVFGNAVADPGAGFAVAEAFGEFFRAALLSPAGNDRGSEGGGRGGVGILVGENFDAAFTGPFDAMDEGVGITPDGRAERFNVSDDSRQMGGFGNLDDFVDRSDEADRVVGFVADMALVNAAEFRGDFGEFDELAGWGETAGSVER